MKAVLLLRITVVLGASMLLQGVIGGKSVTNKKVEKWMEKSKDDEAAMKLGYIKSKNTDGQNEIQNLLDIIQYVITDTINNKEFRSFMVKRFLHNYLPQASEYLNKIKELKKEMDSISVKEDERKDKAMQSQL